MGKIVGYPLAILFFMAGCTTIKVEKTGMEIVDAPVKVLKVGVTTKAEVIKLYGEPSKVSMKEDSEELIYESKTVETPSYMGGLVINEAGRVVTLKRLEVVVRGGVVQSYRFESKGE